MLPTGSESGHCCRPGAWLVVSNATATSHELKLKIDLLFNCLVISVVSRAPRERSGQDHAGLAE